MKSRMCALEMTEHAPAEFQLHRPRRRDERFGEKIENTFGITFFVVHVFGAMGHTYMATAPKRKDVCHFSYFGCLFHTEVESSARLLLHVCTS